ncbi:MAG: putative acyl-CoA thioesterase [Pseudonocardiales bacterium]|nr:putative acyl-CoA thioesterase [Pseudonocardiales bacterium]
MDAAGWENVRRDAEPESPSLLDLLTLEEVDKDLYRANTVFSEPYPLYGGQVAAQALLAAGLTVEAGRHPHSLHGYFLRSGNAGRPTIFHVDRDRDGRSFSARRVVAVQGGEVLFNMSCSFHVAEDGLDLQMVPAPPQHDPETMPDVTLSRLFSVETRAPAEQPFRDPAWPTLFWARSKVPLPEDPLINSCVLTYISDVGSGLAGAPGAAQAAGSSLDHAMWFHRPPRLDDWVIINLVPTAISGGRGHYTGSVHDPAGRLVASLSQEALYRVRS